MFYYFLKEKKEPKKKRLKLFTVSHSHPFGRLDINCLAHYFLIIQTHVMIDLFCLLDASTLYGVGYNNFLK